MQTIFPTGNKEDFIDSIVYGMRECQKDIAFNTHLRDRWKEEPEIVWKTNELIKEGVCHLEWLMELAKKAMK